MTRRGHSLPPLRGRVASGASRERGRQDKHRPSPDLLRRPPSPAEGERENSCNVLTLFLTGLLTLAITWFILVLGGARSRGVADAGRGAVPPQASHACGRGRSILA